MSEQDDEVTTYLELLFGRHEVQEATPGVYQHTFTPPDMTMEDVMRLLSRIPTEEVSHAKNS